MELKSSLKKTPEQVFEEQALAHQEAVKQGTEVDETTTSTEDDAKQQRNIQFGTVNLRFYPITIGDNPCAKRGPPIQLDWKPIEQFVFPVDEYETNHERREVFLLVSNKRIELLKEQGFAADEIDKAVEVVREVKRLRATTIANLKKAWREERAEERREKFHRFLACGKPEEEILDYPRVTVQKDAYWDEQHKVEPMFDHIPCTHCAEMACTGPGCDLEARVGMFRCDGKSCRLGGGKNCPFTGREIGGSKKAATPAQE